MRNKKVLFLVNHDVVIYNFRLELIEKLLAEGYEVHISSPNGEKIKRLINLGCEFHEIKLDRRGTNILKDATVLKEYYKLIKKLKPLIVLTYTIKPNIYGGFISRLLKVPYMSNITGLGSSISNESNKVLKRILRILYKSSLKKSNCVFFQNQANLNSFLKADIKLRKYKLLPGSGVNVDKFAYTEYPNNEKINIYYFGRLMKDKGTYELLEAAKILKNKFEKLNIHLVGFSEDNQLTQQIKLYHNENIVINHGYQEDIYDYIQQADAVIQPSYHEGMSNVLLEASSSGRPVLASNIPGCKEIIDDKITGYLFEVKNVKDIVEKIEAFINLSHSQRSQMGKLARKKMIKEFSREIVTNAYMEEIELLSK
ncbi:glycosyltransferase family 4 protein [Aerococcaceae bacterium WGS1372]